MRIMLPSLRLPRDGPRLCFRAKGKSEGMACIAAGDGKPGRGVYEMLADRLWATGTSCGWMEPLQDGVGGEIGDCWVTGGWSCGEPEGREGVDDDGRTEGDQQDRMRIVGQCHVIRCCFLPAFSHCPQKPAFSCRWPLTKREKYEYVGLRRPRWSMSTSRLNAQRGYRCFPFRPESGVDH